MSTIVKDQHGNRLSLSSKRLTQLRKSCISCYLNLVDLPITGGRVPVHFRDILGCTAPRPVDTVTRTIGCCTFSPTSFAKIIRAAKAVQKAR